VVRVGFLGLGKMGRHLARHLLEAPFPLAVHDLRPESAVELLASGATWAESPRALATDNDIVLTCLPGPDAFEAVLLGSEGLRHGFERGSVLVDLTTNRPRLLLESQESLLASDVSVLDAPMSGGVSGARAGTLTLQVGGDIEALAKARPVLESFSSTILHLGPLGTGSIAKILHNAAVFSANVALVECLSLGIRAGVSARALVELFQKSGIGRNHDLQVSLPETLFRGDFEPRFALETAYKDLGLALEIAEEMGVTLESAVLCREDMEAALARGLAGSDHAVSLTLVEERIGARIRLEDENR
jgi:3-hydroxyisobutyrate dehydrogenase-like beta-hydroxyacid dehydrogenase